MRKQLTMIFLLLVWTTLVGCVVSERAVEIATLAGDVQAGSVLYGMHCSDCHGDDGTTGRPSLLREDIVNLSKEEHADIIIERMEERGRRSQRVSLTNQEIADIISYVQFLQGID